MKKRKIKVGDLVISNDLSDRGDEFERIFVDSAYMDYEIDAYEFWYPGPALVLEVKPAPWSKAKVLAGDKMGWIWCDYLEVVG
jgi:hypothetical protein